jgi:RNA recognition motif-containing protein
LPYDITEDQVGDKFRKFGEIDQVRFATNYANKKFKGFAYVDFKFSESVPRALDLNGTDFKGRSLIVDGASTPARKGYKIRLHDEGNRMYNKTIKKEIAYNKRRKEKMREKMNMGKQFH